MPLLFRKEFMQNPEFRTPPVAHQVPIATVRDNLYVLTDGSLAAVFRVEGMQYDLAAKRDFADFAERLQQVLNTLQPNVQFKHLHRVTHNYTQLLNEHMAELDGKNAFARYVAWEQARRFWHEMKAGFLLRSENLIVLTYNPQVRWWQAESVGAGIADLVGSLRAGGPVIQRKVKKYKIALDKFESMIRPIIDQMALSGLAPQRLDNTALYSLAWEILNPTVSLDQPPPTIRKPLGANAKGPLDWHPDAGAFAGGYAQQTAAKRPGATVVAPISEREQLVAEDWRLGEDWLKIGPVYYAAISMRMLPTSVYPGLSLQLAGLPFEATIAIDAVMLQKQKELEKAWSTARSDQSKAQATLLGGAADPAKVAAAQEKQDAYMQLSSAEEYPFRFRLSIVVAAPDPKTLQDRCGKVTSLLRNIENAAVVRQRYGVDTAVKSTWPFAPISDLNCRKAFSSQIACMMPMYSRWEGSLKPVTLFTDPARRLVKHDPFPWNQHNRNKTICGKSGSGKSFATQLADVQPHAAKSGSEVLIVESGGSFLLTTTCFGGQYLKLGPSCPYNINPFDLPPGFEAMSEEQQEMELRYKYGFIKNLVLTMARLTDPASQVMAENVVGAVAQRTYAAVASPRLRDFYRILGEYRNPEDPDAERLAGRLRTSLTNYVVKETGEAGIYSRYFDTFTNFDAEADIICFDLIDVKNDPALLGPMAMVTILGLIYNRLMKRDKARLVIIDEAWALIKDGPNGEQSPAGQGIELFWREGRKLGASSTMISQNYSDMTQDKVGRAVVGNSPIQYFLVHEPIQANDEAFKSGGFTKHKTQTVYDLTTKYGEFSEILIKEGGEWGVVRLPSAGIKYWLATTDPKDLAVRNKYMETYQKGYGLDQRVVVALLAEDYPGGVHATHGKPMSEQEALQFSQAWLDFFRRFSELVERGETIPFDFR
jgi:type IV secretory pathway VirB4 component